MEYLRGINPLFMSIENQNKPENLDNQLDKKELEGKKNADNVASKEINDLKETLPPERQGEFMKGAESAKSAFVTAYADIQADKELNAEEKHAKIEEAFAAFADKIEEAQGKILAKPAKDKESKDLAEQDAAKEKKEKRSFAEKLEAMKKAEQQEAERLATERLNTQRKLADKNPLDAAHAGNEKKSALALEGLSNEIKMA